VPDSSAPANSEEPLYPTCSSAESSVEEIFNWPRPFPLWRHCKASRAEDTVATYAGIDHDQPVEYLADLVANVPDGTPVSKVGGAKEAEKRRAAELTAAGHLLRLWRRDTDSRRDTA
jgi:Muconolactone delta-isomerase